MDSRNYIACVKINDPTLSLKKYNNVPISIDKKFHDTENLISFIKDQALSHIGYKYNAPLPYPISYDDIVIISLTKVDEFIEG